jgi:hypothetical protein
MAWKRNILVIANITATSDELLDELRQRAAKEPASFTLIVPATSAASGRRTAAEKASAAIERLRAGGLEADGGVGDADPLIAVTEAWDPKRYDEIIVSTLPTAMSKWLQTDLPHRVEKLTGAPVTHIIAMPARQHETTAAKTHERHGVMTPLTVLGWGRAGHGAHAGR